MLHDYKPLFLVVNEYIVIVKEFFLEENTFQGVVKPSFFFDNKPKISFDYL